MTQDQCVARVLAGYCEQLTVGLGRHDHLAQVPLVVVTEYATLFQETVSSKVIAIEVSSVAGEDSLLPSFDEVACIYWKVLYEKLLHDLRALVLLETRRVALHLHELRLPIEA